MNAKQAKEIPLAALMERLGYQVEKRERGGTEHKYLSPFRVETEPSFNVNLVKNSWYDFGADTGGNTLDFAIEYLKSQGKSCRVSDALAWLDTLHVRTGGVGGRHKDQTALFSFSEQSPPQAAIFENQSLETDRDLELVKTAPLRSNVIFKYLEGRGIPRALAMKYLVLVQYENTKQPRPDGKPFFAFGMENDSGGYEIRNASDSNVFKSALVARDTTLIPGSGKSPSVVNVFEGMTDFLSLLVFLGAERLSGDALILHSLSSFERSTAKIQTNDYKVVNLFLDNNAAGRKCAGKFLEAFGDKILDQSGCFAPHVDLNAALQAGHVLNL